MRTRRARLLIVGSAVSVAAILTVACGTAAATRPSDGPPAQAKKAMLKFARCMREHGVDMPDPKVTSDESGGTQVIIGGPGGPGGSDGGLNPESATFKRAEKACRKYMRDVIDTADAPKLDPEQEKKMRLQALKFARCMREEGIDFPDPQFEGGGVTQRVTKNAADNPRFEAAQKRCAKTVGGLGGPKGGPSIPIEGTFKES